MSNGVVEMVQRGNSESALKELKEGNITLSVKYESKSTHDPSDMNHPFFQETWFAAGSAKQDNSHQYHSPCSSHLISLLKDVDNLEMSKNFLFFSLFAL